MKVFRCDCGIGHMTRARRDTCRQAPAARKKAELYRRAVERIRANEPTQPN